MDTMDRFIKEFSHFVANYSDEHDLLFRACTTEVANEADLLKRAELIEFLDDAAQENPALMVLSNAILDQVEQFEHNELPEEPHLALKTLMKSNKIKQKDLAPVATQSIISEILNQNRKMTVAQIKGFAKFFSVPVTTFMKK